MRSEIEKGLLTNGLSDDDPLKLIIDNIEGTGSVLEMNGGVGIIAEYMAQKGFSVILQDSNRLSFSYRKNIVPNSTVKQWPIDLVHIKINSPTFDYVVASKYDQSLASKIAKIAVINKTEKTITYVQNVDNSSRDSLPEPETNRDIEGDRKIQDEQVPNDSGPDQGSSDN